MISKLKTIGNSGETGTKVIVAFIFIVLTLIIIVAFAGNDIIVYAKGLVDIVLDKDASDLVEYDQSLQNAITCVYYRCEEGCSSNKIRDLEIETAYGTLNCKEDFCEPFQDADGKVCGEVPLEQRVEVLLTETTKLKTFDVFKFLELSESCSPQESDMWYPVVNVDESSGSTCYDKDSMDTDAIHTEWYTKCDIKAGTYHLHTVHYTEGIAMQFERQIMLCPVDPQGHLPGDNGNQIELP